MARPRPAVRLVVQTAHPLEQVRDRHGRYLVDAHPGDRHRLRLGFEPRAAAGRAGAGRHELLNARALIVGRSLLVAALQVGDHAFKLGQVLALPAPKAAIANHHRAVVAAVQQQVELLRF